MTYTGPERRTPDALLQEIRDLKRGQEHLMRLIEGEEGGEVEFSRGIMGEIKDLMRAQAATAAKVAVLEQKWVRVKWTVIGAAAGGGVMGGGALQLLVAAVT